MAPPAQPPPRRGGGSGRNERAQRRRIARLPNVDRLHRCYAARTAQRAIPTLAGRPARTPEPSPQDRNPEPEPAVMQIIVAHKSDDTHRRGMVLAPKTPKTPKAPKTSKKLQKRRGFREFTRMERGVPAAALPQPQGLFRQLGACMAVGSLGGTRRVVDCLTLPWF